MNVPRRHLLFVATVAMSSASAARGETTPPAGPLQAPQSAASIPDISAIWTHAALGFESPISGPGPVRNLTRVKSGPNAGASDFNKPVGDYNNPILQPWAAEVVKKSGEISLSGRIYPDPDNQCLLNPVPYIFWNFEIQVLQLPDNVV